MDNPYWGFIHADKGSDMFFHRSSIFAGGHAKVIADILEIRGIIPAGIFDDDLSKKTWNYPTLTFPGPFNFSSDEMIISVGNNHTRKKICGGKNVKYHIAIHPAAVLSVQRQ